MFEEHVFILYHYQVNICKFGVKHAKYIFPLLELFCSFFSYVLLSQSLASLKHSLIFECTCVEVSVCAVVVRRSEINVGCLPLLPYTTQFH